MKKMHVLRNPTRTTDLNFDDLYDDISNNLDLKIERFMKRHRRFAEE